MKNFIEWCQHYGYDPANPDAKGDYARYRGQLEFFQSISKEMRMKEYYKGMCLFDDKSQTWRWGIIAGPDKIHSKVIELGEQETEEVATDTMNKVLNALNIELSEKTETMLKKRKIARDKNAIETFNIYANDEATALRRIVYCAAVFKYPPECKHWSWWVEDHTRHNFDTSTADTYDEAIRSVARFIAFRHLRINQDLKKSET